MRPMNSTKPSNWRCWLSAALVMSVAACNVGESTDPNSPEGKGVDSPPLRALTMYEIQNTIGDVYGDFASDMNSLQPQFVRTGVETLGGPEFAFSASRSDELETILEAVSKRIVNDGKLKSCLAASDFSCLDAEFKTSLPLLFKRPVQQEEVDAFVKIASDNAAELGRATAMTHAVEATLLSPETFYLISIGGEGAADGEMTQLELAGRLSYTIWASAPDITLINAAVAGELGTNEQVEAQARRLLADPKSTRGMTRFVLAWSAGLDLGSRLKNESPNWNASIVQDALTETTTFVREWWKAPNPTLSNLFESNTTYINENLATYYGFTYPGGGGFQKITLPADSKRGGLLTQITFLAATTKTRESSPTLRGRWMMEKGLCRSMGTSPPEAASLSPMHVEGEQTREYHEQLMTLGNCASCHKQMEPPGFVFEGFDGTGVARTMQSGRPIREDATITTGSDLDGTYPGPKQFMSALAKSASVRTCVANYFLAYGMGRVAYEGDQDLLATLTDKLNTNAHDAMVTLVTSTGFRKANK